METLSSLNSAKYPQAKFDQYLKFKSKLLALKDQVRNKESELKERLQHFEFINDSINEINKWCAEANGSLIDMMNGIEIDQVQSKLSYLQVKIMTSASI